MEIIKLAQYDDGQGLTVDEAINQLNKRKLRGANNQEINLRLRSDLYKTEREMYPCWTGTFITYPEVGEPFGESAQFGGLLVKIPKEFQGRTDSAIVCNHPDFILENNTVKLGKSAKLISFPEEDGWYLPDRDFGVPNGQQTNTQKDGYLWRRNEEYAGLLSRSYGRFDGSVQAGRRRRRQAVRPSRGVWI